jgi:hypothetical protein
MDRLKLLYRQVEKLVQTEAKEQEMYDPKGQAYTDVLCCQGQKNFDLERFN